MVYLNYLDSRMQRYCRGILISCSTVSITDTPKKQISKKQVRRTGDACKTCISVATWIFFAVAKQFLS